MANDKLTVKQQKFIDCYAGNATEAARLAGYKGNENTLRVIGQENLLKPAIAKAIEARQKEEKTALIASREERQQTWTALMRDKRQDVKNRLKASELLGRSEGDFLDRHDHTSSDGSMTPPTAIQFVPYVKPDTDNP